MRCYPPISKMLHMFLINSMAQFVSQDVKSQMFIMICYSYSEGNFYNHSDPFKVVIVPWCINITCVIRLMHYKWGRQCLSKTEMAICREPVGLGLTKYFMSQVREKELISVPFISAQRVISLPSSPLWSQMHSKWVKFIRTAFFLIATQFLFPELRFCTIQLQIYVFLL